MCGITGLWHRGSQPVDEAVLASFTHSLAHRGPDGWGFHVDEEACLGLGHRRLAILDLSDSGRQPMSNAGGRYWLTFNGEIYNFLELRQKLEALGHVFCSRTDSEVILAAYAQWGRDCQERFNGMWAFAVWDKIERTLFLSRDRFGVKPLFYWFFPGGMAFASEMKAFLALPWHPGGVDQTVITRALDFPNGIEAGEECLLAGVKRLPAGHCLTVGAGDEPRPVRWWRTLDHLPEAPTGFHAQTERFTELFADAVRLRMRSDTAVGTALSGGLDSSSVARMMAEVMHGGKCLSRSQPDWRKAFVGLYSGTVHDESEYARMAVRAAGVDGIFEEITAEKALEVVDDVMRQVEEVNHEIPTGPSIIYRTMREHGVVVSLDGHAGDEVLGGYRHQIPWAMADTLGSFPFGIFKIPNLRRTMLGYNPPRLERYSPAWRNRANWGDYPFPLPDHPGLAEDLPRLSSMDCLTRGLYLDTHYSVLPVILRNFDRLSMGHGVEVRAPFLDWRLVCFAFALPGSSKIGREGTKCILRAAMKGLLPKPLRLRRSKIGFGNPKLDWLAGPFKPYVLDCVRSSWFREAAAFDGNQAAKQVEQAYEKGDTLILYGVEKQIIAARLGLFLSKREARQC